MEPSTRREFNRGLLESLLAYGLIETLFSRDLVADGVKPIVQRWLLELNDLSRDLKEYRLKDVEFQAKLEELYRRVDLDELTKLVQVDRLMQGKKYPERGALSLGLDLTKVEGMPKKLFFGRQIFAMTKGRSVVPHGHDNMATGFIILRGNFTGKHYERVEDHDDHYLIKPTIDRTFKPGEVSTVSDHKDNISWSFPKTVATMPLRRNTRHGGLPCHAQAFRPQRRPHTATSGFRPPVRPTATAFAGKLLPRRPGASATASRWTPR